MKVEFEEEKKEEKVEGDDGSHRWDGKRGRISYRIDNTHKLSISIDAPIASTV